MARWKIDFAGETIGDDQGGRTVELLDLAGESLVDTVPLAGGNTVAKFPRGNVNGVFSVNITKSHASLESAYLYLLTEFAKLNRQGVLKLYSPTVALQWTGAILRRVARAPQSGGVKIVINYVFEVTALTQG